jgi:hypothetical protein
MKMKAFAVVAALASGAVFLLPQDKQPPTVVAPKGKSVTAKERDAINKIGNAKTPDEKIAAVDAFVTGFPDSSFKAAALYEAAEAADQKPDYIKAISYGDLSIEADPKAGTAMNAMLLVAGEIAQHTQKNSLTKEQDLAKAEKYVKDALEMLPLLTKPEGSKASDSDWETFKKEKGAEGHRDLGLIDAARLKWPEAANEFKAALDAEATPDIVIMVRLANADNEAKKYSDAEVVLKKLLDTPDLNAQVKAVATQEKARADQGLKAATK